MKLLASLCILALSTIWGHSQELPDGRSFVRIPVYHADPWSVKALLEGISISQPELSSILGFAGIPDKDSDLIGSIFGGQGHLIVNPTDNSLLFFPTKKN